MRHLHWALAIAACWIPALSFVSADQPSTRSGEPPPSVEQAKVRYESQVSKAKRDYLDTIVRADTAYLASLNTAIQAATRTDNADLVGQLNAERERALDAAARHRDLRLQSLKNVRSDGQPAKNHLIRAIYIVRGSQDGPSFDVTDKVRVILQGNTGNFPACGALFGDPEYGASKELRIEYSRPDGQTSTTVVQENDRIPKFDLPWDALSSASSANDDAMIP